MIKKCAGEARSVGWYTLGDRRSSALHASICIGLDFFIILPRIPLIFLISHLSPKDVERGSMQRPPVQLLRSGAICSLRSVITSTTFMSSMPTRPSLSPLCTPMTSPIFVLPFSDMSPWTATEPNQYTAPPARVVPPITQSPAPPGF